MRNQCLTLSAFFSKLPFLGYVVVAPRASFYVIIFFILIFITFSSYSVCIYLLSVFFSIIINLFSI